MAPMAMDELVVRLKLPVGWQGRVVPASIVVMELMWQHYGLDMLHPEVSRWLEQNAPDLKSALSGHQFMDDDCFQVGANRIIELRLSLETDDRLRAVSTQYLLSQIQSPVENQTEYRQAS
jgi:hypothetical protein